MTSKPPTPQERRDLVLGLRAALEAEVKIFERYLAHLEEERALITTFDSEALRIAGERKEELHREIQIAQSRRVALMRLLFGGAESDVPRLRELSQFEKSDPVSRELSRLGEKLRLLIETVRERVGEMNETTQYSLGLINGLLSIVYSATQNVVDGYDGRGVRRSKYHSVPNRSSGVLREA